MIPLGPPWSERSQRSFSRRERTFWRFVEDLDPDGCWPWLGPHRGDYGTFPVAGGLVPAHKAMVLYLGLPCPQPLVVDHMCQIRRCVSPNHLDITTQAENVRRIHNRPPEFTRDPTISPELPTDKERWLRQSKLKQRRDLDGWQSPILVDGIWRHQYGPLPDQQIPPNCRCPACMQKRD